VSWPFQAVARRKVNGGPKATASDEITWAGLWRERRWLLVSRPRLNNPLESFVTSSGHRLRDSWVGSSGHWIDLVVKEPRNPSDDELEELQVLAQQVDSRPVRVRRYQRRAEPLTPDAGLLV
jgi:hypothetical protein